MAVGDVVSQLSGLGTAMTFQPAAGVEVMITWFSTDVTVALPLLDSAAGSASIVGNTTYTYNMSNVQFFVNNSIYLTFVARASNRTGFTGIQTK